MDYIRLDRLLSVWIISTGFLLLRCESAFPPVITSFNLGETDASEVFRWPGDRLFIRSSVSGDPEPVIQLYKDGQVISVGKIFAKAVELEDAGVYWIIANNTLGSAISRKVLHTVYYMNPWPASSNEIVSLTIGEHKVIDVPDIDATPQPNDDNVVWRSNVTEQIRTDDLHFYISKSRQLVILDANLSFSGSKYQAVYTPPFSPAALSKVFQIEINDRVVDRIAPTIVIALPEETQVVLGDNTIKLECVVNARPIADLVLRWFKIDSSVSDTRQPVSSNMLKKSNRLLEKTFPTLVDDGVIYECEAELPGYPAVTTRTTISILDKPNFSVFLQSEYEYELNTQISLTCSATGNPAPVITWYKNGEEIMSGIRTSIHFNGTLILYETRLSDKGVYQCRASNKVGEVWGHTFIKILSSPPVFTAEPSDSLLIGGNDAVLECAASGKPEPVLEWIFRTDSGDVELSTGGKFHITSTSLTITSAQWDNSGTYVCQASNKLGSVSSEASLVVYNRTSIRGENTNKEEEKGTTVVRNCLLNKDSRVDASVAWFKDNVPITLGSGRTLSNSNQTLTINVLRTTHDQGVFSCVVTSIAGNTTQSHNITVFEVPQQPEPFARLFGQKPRTILLTWEPPYNGNRPILQYIVRMKIDGASSMTIQNASVPARATSHEVSNLKPSRSYEFTVTAVNSFGEGQESRPTSSVTIPAEIPSRAPVIIDVEALTSTSIKVRWLPPPEDFWNGALTGYNISYYLSLRAERTYVLFESPSTGPMQADIENLSIYTQYYVEVAAVNAVGTGTFSEGKRVQTKEGVPEQAPIIASVVSQSSTTVDLTWERPSAETIHGITIGYTVKMYEKDDPFPSKEENILRTSNRPERATIRGLKKYTFYRLSILLYTNGGNSPLSYENVTTQQDKPERVGDLRDAVVTHTSITVGWNPPSTRNGILTNYRITISGGGLNATQYFVTHPTTTRIISNLNSLTDYAISVEAATEKGFGPPSTISIRTRPPPVRPEPPVELVVTNVESRSVVVRFKPGSDGQAPIEAWHVNATSDITSGEWTAVGTFEGIPDARDVKITGLQPYTKYYFRIMAENIVGSSNSSVATSPITTKMDRPDHAPVNITIRPQNKTTLIVSWEALEPEAFNGKPEGYNISYTSVTSNTTLHQFVYGAMDRFLIIGNLLPFTTYSVTVAAKNTEFSSASSDSVSERTIESVPRNAPKFTAVVDSSSQITINWESLSAAEAQGVIIGYKVIYTNTETNARKTVSTGHTSLSHQLSDLDKYTNYNIQMLAFTRIGDGVISASVLRRTRADGPGPPASFSLKSVQPTSITLVWQPPKSPNGPAPIKYILSYKGVTSDTTTRTEDDLTVTTFVVRSLRSGILYNFNLTAENRLYVGEAATVTVRTSAPSSQRPPDSPSNLQVESTSITATSVTLTWNEGQDGGLPIRNYSLRIKPESAEQRTDVVPGGSTRYTLRNLTPYTDYLFEMAAVNDKDSSTSLDRSAKTLAAAPSLPPSDLLAVPHSASSLNISWVASPSSSWNGPVPKTTIWYDYYQPESRKAWTSFRTENVSSSITSWMLNDLEKGKLYEIRLSSSNNNGYSPSSIPAIVYVGVAVPTGSPTRVTATMIDDKRLRVNWHPLAAAELNGQLLGYKVYYESANKRNKRDADRGFELVAPDKTSHVLGELNMFTQYFIYITAYNIAGEGPRSVTVNMTTDEGKPGKPRDMAFLELTLRTVNVTWEAPDKPNGIIVAYIVSHYIISANGVQRSTSEHFREVVVQSQMHQVITLDENSSYNFSVQARTRVEGGEQLFAHHVTGPYPNVPPKPSKAEFSQEDDGGVTLRWELENEDVLGFVIEGWADGEEWKLVYRSSESVTMKKLSSSELGKDNITYTEYRVSVFNKIGLGLPRKAELVKPFYTTWEFMIIMALTVIIIIVVVIAVLCCEFFKRRAKLAEEAYEHDVIGTGNGELPYNTYEMRQSFKRNSRRGSKYREPPRPSPGSIQYSVDEVPPGYDDSSDVTEKADLDSSDDDDDKKGHMSSDSSDEDMEKSSASAPSYNHYQYGGYNRYVSSGAVHQSWQNSYKARNGRNMYGHTDSEAGDSEATSSHYRPGLSIGSGPLSLDTPDVPGSRAPLPGFSSFV